MTRAGASKGQYEEYLYNLELQHGHEAWFKSACIESDDAGIMAAVRVLKGMTRPKLLPPSVDYRVVIYEVNL